MSKTHPLLAVVEVCEQMLARARHSSPSSYRVVYGHGLFAKAVQHGRSIVTLATSDHKCDVGAICTLARCLMELHRAAAYFLEVGLTKDEQNLRLQLFSLNHSTDIKRIHERLGIVDSAGWHEMGIRWSLEELGKNPLFLALDKKHRDSLSRGKSPYARIQHFATGCLPQDIEKGLYTLFSHSAHSFSLGLPEIGGGSASPAGVQNSFLLAVDAASLHLASFGLLYWRLRHRAIKQISTQERQNLEAAASPRHIFDRLDEIRAKYPSW